MVWKEKCDLVTGFEFVGFVAMCVFAAVSFYNIDVHLAGRNTNTRLRKLISILHQRDDRLTSRPIILQSHEYLANKVCIDNFVPM